MVKFNKPGFGKRVYVPPLLPWATRTASESTGTNMRALSCNASGRERGPRRQDAMRGEFRFSGLFFCTRRTPPKRSQKIYRFDHNLRAFETCSGQRQPALHSQRRPGPFCLPSRIRQPLRARVRPRRQQEPVTSHLPSQPCSLLQRVFETLSRHLLTCVSSIRPSFP